MLIMLGVLAIGPLLIVTSNIYGTPQTVTVSFHKRIRGKGQNPHVASCGYYYVKGKRYTAQTSSELPIGAKFEVKINPIIPREHNVIRIIQE
jgi:hypothetical protein